MIGKTISHYKILEEIGRGGMGEVYLAEDTKLKRKVALKFLHPELTRDKETKKRFIHEAQIASTLEHTNICTIHEIGETKPAPGEPGEGQLFISMAYYKGETLKSKIEDSPFKIYDLIGIAIQITQGLARAHESNIIHRDLKPANIIITDHGEVKIVDFGLAKLAGQTKLTKEGTTLGTVAYMSPEQSRGEAVDLKTDIWSIGVMLYEMITGQLPFKGDYEQAILYSIMNDEPEPVTALRTGVPMELERIVNKCLSKNPEVRYQHADDLSADLKKLQGDLEGSKQTALPVKEIQKLPEQKLKRIAFYAGFLLFITILIISAIYLYDRFFKPEESQTEIVNQPVWENSIAVLPFKNISPDPEQEYFCDGITEQIITNLTKLNRLKVIARTSVMKFKDTKKTIPEIGKELNVAHVLEGSVRKSGTRIRVTAQLIKTEDGYHLWAEDYDRELSDIFTVQDDVSRSISEALLGQLNQESLELIKTDKPEDIELYDNYLRAKNFHYKFLQFQKPDYLTDAIRILTDILDKEPDYLDATIELADVYNSYYNMVSETAEEKMQYLHLQEKYIEKAYQLNPKSSDVLYVKMLVSLARYEADHPENKEEYEFNSWKEFLKLYPHHHDINMYMGLFLQSHGLVYHSFPYYNKAVEVDPLHPWNYSGRGHSYYQIGEFDKAVKDFEKGLEIEPDNYWNLVKYMYLLIMLRQEEEAKKLLGVFEEIYPEEKDVINYRKSLLMALKKDSTTAFMFYERSGFDQSSKVDLYLLLDEKDEVIELIQDRQDKEGKNITRSRFLSYKNLTWYDTLREDERFQKILEVEKERYQIILEKYKIIN